MKLKNIQKSFTVLLVYLSIYVDHGTGYMIDGNQYNHKETLDPRGKYLLEWAVDWVNKRITFNVTVETRGYVGFGLSDNGKMTGADIVIGGLFPNGEIYFTDRHAVASQTPVEDASQDWELHEALEDRTHTFLSFSRDFDTCDPEDYEITEDKITIIWAYGERDDLLYHHRNRGIFNAYLLHPDYSPLIEMDPVSGRPFTTDVSTGEDFKVWTVERVMEIPAEDTTYWCSMEKAPQLPRKHHVVGVDVRFGNAQSRSHVHQLLIYKCNTPLGRNGTEHRRFSDFVFHRGQQCLTVREPTGPIPTEYCTELFIGWAVGGRPFFNPPHVGFPFGNTPDEYYLVQVHYDNPNKTAGRTVDLKMDIFYTSELRPNEGGMLNIGHTSPGRTLSLLVPPSSIDHTIHGICGSHCTREILPKRGIHIYGLILRSYNSGKKMKLQHFRQTRELPWITSDANFGNDYQQFRVLPEERTVLPWDVLVITCEYDNSWTNGSVVGGYSTSRQEICSGFLLYYNKIPNYQQCTSEIGSRDFRQSILGFRNITWSNSDLEFLVADKGHSWTGMRVSEVSNNYVDWTVERRNELQKFQLTSQHVNWCYREVYAGGPVNTPETELIPPRPRRQKQASKSIGRRRRRRQSPTMTPRYEPEWQDPRRFSHYPHETVKPYVPPERSCLLGNDFGAT